MSGDVIIRTLLTADFDQAAALDEGNLSAWSSKLIAEHAAQQGCWHFGAWHTTDKLIIGYILGRSIAEEAEIFRLSVAKRLYRQGIGSQLLSHALAIMKNVGVRKCFLEVRHSNQAARLLYEKSGFAVSGVRKAYYQNPLEDALLMVRNV